MEVQERNATRVYALSNGPSLPEWMGERARRNLSKRDASVRRRVELLQDFDMPVASSKLVQTPDGRYLFASGTYPPRIRCYDLTELGMKFERYVDGDVVDMTALGNDYGKFAALQDDRTVSFHAPYGHHDKVRIPTFGRAMSYEPSTCELLVACSGRGHNRSTATGEASAAAAAAARENGGSGGGGGGEVYRFNLDEGRFSQPLTYSSSSKSSSSAYRTIGVGGTCIAVSPTHALTALGGEDGLIRFWDNRIPPSSSPADANLRPFVNLDVSSGTAGYGYHDDSGGRGGGAWAHSNPAEVTSVSFDRHGMRMCAGTAGGTVALYDLRSSRPLHVKEHQYGLPIHTVQFHGDDGSIVLSADSKLVKAWRAKPGGSVGGGGGDADGGGAGGGSDAVGSVVVNVEGTADFSHFISSGDESDPSGCRSGLLLCAGEQPQMQAFYCPILGAAPGWVAFLDGITEELEERDRAGPDGTTMGAAAGADDSAASIYEDYKFLTRSEIDSLGMQSLVGTPLLRGYMHGFFVDVGLYNRVRAVANPFEYEEYRKKKIRERVEEKRASRIAPRLASSSKKKAASVNPELAQRLEGKAGEGKSKAAKLARSVLDDDRFGNLFSNPDFQINEDDINFKLRNPSGVAASKHAKDNDMDSDRDDSDDDDEEEEDSEGGGGGVVGGFKQVEDDEDENDEWGSEHGNVGGGGSADVVDYESDSDEDGFRGAKVRGENYDDLKAMERASRKRQSASVKQKEKKKQKKKSKRNVMYEANDYGDSSSNALGIGLGDVSASTESERRRKEITMSLAERIQMRKEHASATGETKMLRVKGEGSTKEVSYVPRSARKKVEEMRQADLRSEGERSARRKRRGVKELRFKAPFKPKAGHHTR